MAPLAPTTGVDELKLNKTVTKPDPTPVTKKNLRNSLFPQYSDLLGLKGLTEAFPQYSRGRRGVVAWVERPGTIQTENEIILRVPHQERWPLSS